MEPRVQYAKTSDGVNIAFASLGEGPPLIRLPMPAMSHVQRDWSTFSYVLESITGGFRLIWYDNRGSGLSDRDALDFSMDAMIRDLDAVIEKCALRSSALMAFNDGVPVAVTYASKFPDRVSHLILIDGWIKRSDVAAMPSVEAHDALIDKDWTVFTETMGRVLSGIDDQQIAERFGEHMRACVEPEAWRAFSRAARSWDVGDLLSNVKPKTLVLHNNHMRWSPIRAGQRLAAAIPDARFLAIDDLAYRNVAPLIAEFVGGARETEQAAVRAFRAILFTDVEGSTALTQRLGDERGREVLREHERITREVLKAHGGTEVKTMGDGFMASFGSVTRAVECGIALQRAFDEWNAGAGARHPSPLRVRVGLNAGEPIEEEGPDGRRDLFGATVILASRIAAKAEGGEILVADTVRGLCSGKGFLFADRGEFVAKGFEEPVRVYEVRWRE